MSASSSLPQACRVRGPRPLAGPVALPPDRRVFEELLILATCSDGPCTIRNAPPVAAHWQRALKALNVHLQHEERSLTIDGTRLQMPDRPLACEADRRLLFRLTGRLAGQPFGSRLEAAPPLAQAPIDALIAPLRARGAMIAAAGNADETLTPPISIAPSLPDEPLQGLRCELPAPDPDLKAALLLNGLASPGVTAIWEPRVSDDTLERCLLELGVPLESAGPMVGLDGSRLPAALPAFDWRLPGSNAVTAALCILATATPGSHLRVPGAEINPTHIGWFEGLRLMGAQIAVRPEGTAAAQPIANFEVATSPTRNIGWSEDLLERAEEAMPALIALATAAKGPAEFEAPAYFARTGGADSWRRMLSCFGVEAELCALGLRVHGQGAPSGPRAPVDLPRELDLDQQLTAILLGLLIPGMATVPLSEGFEARYVGMLDALVAAGADLHPIPG